MKLWTIVPMIPLLQACASHEPEKVAAKRDGEQERQHRVVETPSAVAGSSERPLTVPQGTDAMALSLGHGLLREQAVPVGSEETRIWADFKADAYLRLVRDGDEVSATLAVSRGRNGQVEDCVHTFRYDSLQILGCVLERESSGPKWEQLYANVTAFAEQVEGQDKESGLADGFTLYVERRSGSGYTLDVYEDVHFPRVREAYLAARGDVVEWFVGFFDPEADATHAQEH